MFLCSSCGTQQAGETHQDANLLPPLLFRHNCWIAGVAPLTGCSRIQRYEAPAARGTQKMVEIIGAYSICPIPVRAFKMCVVILLMISSLPQEKEL